MAYNRVGIHRHIVPWDRPWLEAATRWLGQGWRGGGPLDLSRTLAIVPTRQSARRLREALAAHAATFESAVFPPLTQTPDAVFRAGVDVDGVASRTESRLAWTQVLRSLDFSEVRNVFRVAPSAQDFRWAWRLSGTLYRLQTQLTEGGLGFEDVVARAGADFPEAERWRELAMLEQRQQAVLYAQGRREPHAAWRDFAREPTIPGGIERVVVLATPDPMPLAVTVLHQWSKHLPIEIVVYGPEAESVAFDDFGRPVPTLWATRVLKLSDFHSQVRLCADPAAEAREAVALVRQTPDPIGLIGIGIADPEVLPQIETELEHTGIDYFNPEGRSRREDRLFGLLSALASLGRSPNFGAVASLSRCPDFLACLQRRHGRTFSIAAYLSELDALHARHLPADLASARQLLPTRLTHAARGLEVVSELHAALNQGAFARRVQSALVLVFGERQFDLNRSDEAELAEAAAAWRDVVRETCAALELFTEFTVDDAWAVALEQYGELRTTREKPMPALELQGWLELLWDDTPQLIVAGLNDGIVPDAIVSDAFLPEGLREKLGLKTNAMRFARDAYLLQALAASRSVGGRLELLFAKTSGSGDPLRPSRLLLACEPGELPDRVRSLFRAVGAGRHHTPWTRAWRLQPRRTSPPARVRVTALKAWLECPFRFYLRHVLGMETVDPTKGEMDAFDFGTLCHSALEAMAREPALRDSVDERELREFLWSQLELAAVRQFGRDLPLPLAIQLESARQRLAGVARLQATERANGWIVAHVEEPFSIDLGGLEVRGKIDRIDRHDTSGAWRVLDYKTSDRPVNPMDSHFRAAKAGDEDLPPWRWTEVEGKPRVWTDLQLPMYLRALARQVPSTADISCGYVNLPKAASSTALALWPDLSRELLDAAWACADGVAASIRAGQFWPPGEVSEQRDAFGPLFHRGTLESVGWEVSP